MDIEGPGKTRLTMPAYALVIRMLAENVLMPRIVQEVQARFPEEHGSDSDAVCTFGVVRRVKEHRQPEVRALQQKLRDHTDDLWIVSKREQLKSLQAIYEDANRWVPTRLLEARGGGSPRVVFTKDTDSMLKALKHAREIVGFDPTSRIAESLEDLVRRTEGERGLEQTVEAKFQVEHSLPVLDDALLIDIPHEQHTSGEDKRRGFLSGDAAAESADEIPTFTPFGGDVLADGGGEENSD